jgi:hypothetical protein
MQVDGRELFHEATLRINKTHLYYESTLIPMTKEKNNVLRNFKPQQISQLITLTPSCHRLLNAEALE